MASFDLYILDYNYSSWSMRAGVLLRHLGVDFREVRFNLDEAGRAQLRQVSPSGLVPMLVHGSLRIWDSLAIAEYLAELFPERSLWPREREARTIARAAACEMHSGLFAMRNAMSMNIRARYPGFPRAPEVDRNVKRVQALWSELRSRFGAGGNYLCGEFGIVDAMFAPVVMRFRTYDVKLEGACAAYAEAMLEQPAVRAWLEAAHDDAHRVPDYDLIVD